MIPHESQPNITIFDVAREAGVSYATVSRVVNNKAHVRPEKREAVLQAMARLGYVANPQARSLAGGRSQVIGLLVHEFGTSYMGALIEGIDEALAATEYDVLLYSLFRRKNREASYVSTITRGLADGLLLVLPRNPEAYLQSLRQRQFPYVLVDHQGIGSGDPAVGATNVQGGYDAARHLIELGHRRIGLITGDMSVRCAVDRVEGFRRALAEFGMPFDTALVREGDFRQPAAYQAAQSLLSLAEPPSAILASNDVSAFAAIDAARDLGLRVSEDVSIVGFDDVPTATMVTPKLTTVRQPLHDMGKLAAHMLIERIANPALPPERRDLPTTLMIRGTTRRFD